MTKGRQYIKKWSRQRLFSLTLGLLLSVVYIANGQNIYLAFAVFLFVRAIFNIGCCGCAGACEQPTDENGKKTTNFEFKNIGKKDE